MCGIPSGISLDNYYNGQQDAYSSRAGAIQPGSSIFVPYGTIPINMGQTEIKKENIGMLKSISSDVRDFMKENKSVIYWVALILVVDHYFFENAFREKLKSLVHKLIGKVENSLDTPEKKS